MSISDVYDMFTRVSSPRYQELHFFGHATQDGPVIVNTDFYENERKFKDKDPRVGDFTNPELDKVFGPSHLDKSRASFRPNPVVCVWGCDVNHEALKLIQQVQAKDAKGQPTGAEVALIREQLAKTYAAHLAKTMNFSVIAALPGMDAVHEGEPNDDPFPYPFHPTAMHVAFSRHEQWMRLYEKHLGIRYPTTGAFKGHQKYGRGYAYFDP